MITSDQLGGLAALWFAIGLALLMWQGIGDFNGWSKAQDEQLKVKQKWIFRAGVAALVGAAVLLHVAIFMPKTNQPDKPVETEQK